MAYVEYEGRVHPLKENCYIGRNRVGLEILGVPFDTRVSRKQILVRVSENNITVEGLGANPSYLLREGEPPIQLTASEPISLKDRDIVYLLVSKYPLKFTIPSISTTAGSELTAASPMEEVTENTKKRKRPETETLEPADNSAQSSSKKPKIEHSGTGSKSAFDELMAHAKHQGAQQPSSKHTAPSKPKPATSGWAGVLGQYCISPEKHPDLVVTYDDKVVVIKDKFPKAKYHYLVMPRQLIDGFEHLDKSHLPLLHDLKATGEKIVEDIRSKDKDIIFRLGFHAVPSMRQLHMHVISQDFDSDCLKNKRHWNSFTTTFFIDVSEFISMLTTHGKITIDKPKYEALLANPLKCHKCHTEQKNIPQLKQHIKICTAR